jgi:hypothetical protein
VARQLEAPWGLLHCHLPSLEELVFARCCTCVVVVVVSGPFATVWQHCDMCCATIGSALRLPDESVWGGGESEHMLYLFGASQGLEVASNCLPSGSAFAFFRFRSQGASTYSKCLMVRPAVLVLAEPLTGQGLGCRRVWQGWCDMLPLQRAASQQVSLTGPAHVVHTCMKWRVPAHRHPAWRRMDGQLFRSPGGVLGDCIRHSDTAGNPACTP